MNVRAPRSIEGLERAPGSRRSRGGAGSLLAIAAAVGILTAVLL